MNSETRLGLTKESKGRKSRAEWFYISHAFPNNHHRHIESFADVNDEFMRNSLDAMAPWVVLVYAVCPSAVLYNVEKFCILLGLQFKHVRWQKGLLPLLSFSSHVGILS